MPSAPAAAAPEDIAELRLLLQTVTRPRVIALLESALATWTAPPPAPAPAPPAPAPPAPVAAPPVDAAVAYTPLESYGFSSEGDFVEVLVLDLPGVGALPKESVTATFTTTSFDLKIHGLGGRNFRLRVPALEKEIKPEESRVVVGKSRVTLKLKARRLAAGCGAGVA